jgi:AcrR family transcriptional regulator
MISTSDSKQAKVQARRDQIVDAAKLCFRQHGFHAASMAEIAHASQLSVGQIYRYFDNKDAIIEESSTASSPVKCAAWKISATIST